MWDELKRHAGKFYGKYSGEVTDDRDDGHFGRVQVKVPAVLGPDVAVRARPCFPYGHFFVPPVGTKVWVEFEAGDVNYPLWVGTWYPDGKTPPEAQRSPPENRVIQTAAGHTIEILDQAGEEKITLRHKSNAFVALDKDGGVLVGAKNGSTVALNAKDGNVMIVEAQGNTVSLHDDAITLMNKGGAATVDLKGGTVQVAGTTILLRASQVVLGEGALEPTLMGNMFTSLFNAHTHATAMGPSGPPLPPLIPQVGPHLAQAVVVK